MTKKIRTYGFVLFFLLTNIAVAAVPEEIERGRKYFENGDLENAALEWDKARKALDLESSPEMFVDVSAHLSRSLQYLGDYRKALVVCNEALPVAEKLDDIKRQAQFYRCIGDICVAFGDKTKAVEYLTKGIEKARAQDDRKVLAAVLIDAANLFTSDKDWEGAMATYAEAIEHAESIGDKELLADAVLNAQYAAVMSEKYEMFDFAHSLGEIESLPDSYWKSQNLIRFGLILRKIRTDLDDEKRRKLDPKIVPAATKAFEGALQIAEKADDFRTMSYTLGYHGQLLEDTGKYEQALRLTRRALFFAGQGENPEILFLWQWQLGRIQAALGNTEKAAESYRSSIKTLNPIRVEMFSGRRVPVNTFNEMIKPVYLELAEILIGQAEKAGDDETRTAKLGEARDTMEMLKTAELEDFFEDECTTLMKQKVEMLDRAPEKTAIVYPIMLPEKPAILLILPGGIKCKRLPVNSPELEATAKTYRRRLQNRLNNRFLYEGEKLYDWVIRPIESELAKAGVETMIFAPDGALRLIPPSTFFDGKKFLIEKYAIVTVPALQLTDPKPFSMENTNILVSGLGMARQGFSPLPSVPKELTDVRDIMAGQELLLNEQFTVDGLQSAFKASEYTIFHMATHGVFGGTPKESFLLSYEGRLDMNALEALINISRFRENAVELLTLSACQTALGNERAALGLAGVAVKAGVRSAIATLWYVDDEATSIAIREFYRQLRKPGMTKAKALQNAQISLIDRPRFWQPIYWAPFLLIGNWM